MSDRRDVILLAAMVAFASEKLEIATMEAAVRLALDMLAVIEKEVQ